MPVNKSNRTNNRIFPLAVVICVMLVFVSIQGYFLLRKEPVGQESIQQKGKPSYGQSGKAKVKPSSAVMRTGEPVGRIAIVIDDWGYNNSHCKYLTAIPGPVGVAILPGLQYSRNIIQCAKENGKQPMLHLPLEPHNLKEIFQQGYVLTTSMDATALKKTLLKIMGEMNGVTGVNNHTGSKGSESELIMTTVLSEVKKKQLFYLDSVTSDHSVAGIVAAKLKRHIAKRDVFLDNRNDRVLIERQFAETAKLAKANGYALAIGHDRALTLQIIIEQMNKLSKEGYDFISVPEYIRKHEYPRY